MNTSTISPSSQPTTPPPDNKDVEQMKQEYAQRIQYASMSEEDLVSCIVDTLEKSYWQRETPFHDSHLQVDLLVDECHRRNQPHLFDRAFQQFNSREGM